MRVKNCLFCGAEGPLTKSHVIASQFITALPGTKEGSRFIEVRNDEYGNNRKTKVHESSKNPRENKPKVLCGKCNNSWMNEHEKKVKGLIVDLELGNNVTLTAQDQSDLALWATIAGAVRGALAFEDPVPIEDAKLIRENDQLPEGYKVWLIQGVERLDWPTRFLPGRALDGSKSGWVAWIWMGHAIFAVASELFALDFYWKLMSVAPAVKQIHPSSSNIEWPYFPESPVTWELFHGITDPGYLK